MIHWEPGEGETGLRDYQRASIDALRDGLRHGHTRQILCAPTGAGKTVCGAYLLQEALAKGNSALFIVDRITLVEQTSRELWAHGITHGVVQGANTYGESSPIQVCSAQTVENRGLWPGAKLIIVDECHTKREKVIDFARNMGVPVIGLTATPFTKGLGDIYSRVVNVTTTNELVASGVLAPLRVFAAKEIDMDGAKTTGGEWQAREVEERGNRIVGDIVEEWESRTAEHFGGPVKTICFSASIAHGRTLVQAFGGAGHRFEQITAYTKDDERRALIDEFRDSDSITGLVSVDALAKGFDVPDIRCGISARPYRKSLSSHIQQIGRAMRSAPGKDFALWLDHAGNYVRFLGETEHFFAQGVDELDNSDLRDTPQQEPTEQEKHDAKCASCGAVLMPQQDACPACGTVRLRRNAVEEVPGVMVEIGSAAGRELPKDAENYRDDRREYYQQLLAACARLRRDPEKARQMAWAQYRDVMGVRPPYEWRELSAAASCDPVVYAHAKGRLIRFAKGKQKRA